jgi:alkanesulfonate monooxygenase SsuD/methylene tetrahydromethanopterin reductase-like flavin-dependent oxidoreductase (luciferase family)
VAVHRLAAFLNPGRDLAGGVELARRAEALGYDSVWVTHGSGRDSFVVLSAYAAATTRLGVGNGVVPIYPRHPVAMAQAALTLSELSAGRFRLGIGVSHRPSMEKQLGLELREPLAGFEIVAAVPLAVTDDGEAAAKAFRAELTRYIQLPFYRAMMERSGLAEALRRFDATGETPDAVAQALGAVGDAATAAAYVRAYRDAGVTLPAIRPITFPDAPWYRRTLEEAAGW